MGPNANIPGTNSFRENVNNGSELIVEMAGAGVIGYFLGSMVQPINPMYPGIFCAVMVPVNRIIEILMKQLFAEEGANISRRIVDRGVSFTSTVAISAFFMTKEKGLPFEIHVRIGAILLAALLLLKTAYRMVAK